MKKLMTIALSSLILISIFKSQEAKAEIPVKARAMLTMAGYGTAGGALLGLASMAFGNSSRAVAQGASLGLYAGLLFGAYVLVSHHNKTAGNYDDSSPYQESSDVYGDEYKQEEGGDSGEESSRGSFFNRFETFQVHQNQAFTFQSEKRKGGQMPPLQMNFFQYSF